jgi:zinc transport system substrate-binding protein
MRLSMPQPPVPQLSLRRLSLRRLSLPRSSFQLGAATRGIAVAALLLACSSAQEDPLPGPAVSEEEGRLTLYTVNYPLKYLAERIGGEIVTVVFPAPPGIDPAYWSPEPEQAAAYQRADLILLNGAGYAAWVDRASFLRRQLIDTSAGFRDRLLPLDEVSVHTHGPEGDHSHSGTAFTTWLDPTLALEHARVIADALADLRPDQREVFEQNLHTLERDLANLDQRLEKVAQRLGGLPLVFSHPVYAYLEQRYRLNGRSLHWEPDRVPDAELWQEFTSLLEAHPAQLMLWEALPKAETQHRLAALGVVIVVYAPSAQPPDTGDWLTAMQSNVAALETYVAERSP